MTRRFLVSGRVQGVGFRDFTRREAMRLGLLGYAANLPDGRVEVVAEGDSHALQELGESLASGPRSAHVTGVLAEPAQVTESFTTFGTR